VFSVALAIIQYVDRVCISKAMPSIQRELGFSHLQVGYLFGAFTLAYALFEIPGGWLGDRFGPKKVLMRVVLWWSFFTSRSSWPPCATTSSCRVPGARAWMSAGDSRAPSPAA
jgi:MFS transporter, ACS family, glucarate transporter